MTTPMMAQWQTCKLQAKEALLFFRLGDFYEAFHEDAGIIAKELSLTLTARQNIPMCGVPFHAAEGYIDKLIGKGYKVAIAEQMEDPKAVKGLVKREITRIVTPGTTISDSLSEKKNNYFLGIVEEKEKYGLAVLDVSTAEFFVKELETKEELADEIAKIKPAEILTSKPVTFPCVVNERPQLTLSLASDVLKGHFDVQSLDGFGLRGKSAAVVAAGTLLLYLKEELNLSLEHVLSVRADALDSFMAIDQNTMRNLDLAGAMLDILDETATPMGARLLRKWLQYPLLSVESIQERQEAVIRYMGMKEARDALKKMRDLERLMMKVAGGFSLPKDLYMLAQSLSLVPEIAKILGETLWDPSAISEKILSAMDEAGIREGYSAELDTLRKVGDEGVSWMARYQTELRESTGLKTLKVGYTRAFGYYIEVSRLQSEKVPPQFHRSQTLTNAERFVTEELKNFEKEALSAEERAKALENALLEELRKMAAGFAPQIYSLAQEIAKQDVLLSFGFAAQKYRWVRPEVDTSDVLEIVEGRHPVIEKSIGASHFIGNDTMLSPEKQMMLITGPNMAGKSTYIRQTALIVVMAQIGSFVPAKRARVGVVDKVFSRIGASDDLARGQSTFMVEMAETANILNNATSKSLVLLDEIGRGTSTYDGISIAWAVAEYLLTTTRKQAKTLFATHYWELTRLESEFPQAGNFQTAIQETKEGIVFLHKIVPGGTDKSYGIHVAKLAGLPSKAIKRAEEMLKTLENPQLPLFTI